MLELSDNEIGDDGARDLAMLLRDKPSIIHLDLNNNHIGDEGIQELARALSNPHATLQRLYLEKNGEIGESGVNQLIEMLKVNRSLERLSLMGCRLNNPARQALRQAAKEKPGLHLTVEP